MRALAVVLVALAVPSTVDARIVETRAEKRARTAPVGYGWVCPLRQYTGGGYSIGHVNQLWRPAPHGPRRQILLLEAVRHHVPLRLLLGVWGAESTWGYARSHFGLVAYYPGTATSGSFAYDAHLAARLLDRLYRGCHGRRAL